MEYGLIGEKLPHSFSGEIHEKLAGYDYRLQELTPVLLARISAKAGLQGHQRHHPL